MTDEDEYLEKLEKNTYIETHENVTISYETAGVGSRFMALAVDLVLIVLLCALTLAYGIYAIVRTARVMQTFRISSIAMLILAVVLIFHLYFILFECLMRGRTPGKCCAGLQVVSVTGEAATVPMLLLRNLMRFFHLIPGGQIADAVVILCNRQSQRAGDILAKTMVIKVRENRKYAKRIDAMLDDLQNEAETAAAQTAAEKQSMEARWKAEMEARMRQGVPPTAEADVAASEAASSEAASGASPSGGPSEAASSEAERPAGAFFDRDEFQMLCTYMHKRLEIGEKDRYDRRIAQLIANRSGATLPDNASAGTVFSFLLQARSFLQQFYPDVTL